MQKLLDIANSTAKLLAGQYMEQEKYRDKRLSLQFVVERISSKIGLALFDAGYLWDDFSYEIRHEIALEALKSAGYLELVKA